MQFLEQIHFRKLGEDGLSNYTSRMSVRRFVGYHEGAGAVLDMSPEGVFRGKNASKMTLAQAWGPAGL